jgi:nitrate/TMAO reductase-like tetraheme cytochrome c subunit
MSPDDRAPAGPSADTAGSAAAGIRARLRGVLARRPRFTFRSRRGRLVAFILVAGFGGAVAIGGVAAVQWTDTADFCGRCHTMGPELRGHELSPHRELGCAECHVEPGIEGWVKAKINGTRQLVELLTGTFPTPIPPPDHAALPSTTVTCQRCHDIAPLVKNGGPVKLVLRTRYALDEANTRQQVATVMRPSGLGTGTATRGIHWHIQYDVEYTSSDVRAQEIDLVRIANPDGTQKTFISMGEVADPTNVQPDIDRLVASEPTRRMDCLDCHNRIGHRLPPVDEAVDDALDEGAIAADLPFIKREAVIRLSDDHDSQAAAEVAIEGLREFYASGYPLIARTRAADINGAIDELKQIYPLVANPELGVTEGTYPDNRGHVNSPGCFRCHDGGHYEVVGGALTTKAIPSACSTCHTFPQIGENTSSILIGERPENHLEALWVFDHTRDISTVDPGGTSCGACHTRTYCENCHQTNAVQVPHDDMVFNHADVTRRVGAQACAFCHQPTYCGQCHANEVLPRPGSTPPP